MRNLWDAIGIHKWSVKSRRGDNRKPSATVDAARDQHFDPTAADNYVTKFHHILQKIGENKKSADSQYHHLMTEIQKILSLMDAIEGEQNQVVNALDLVSKDVDEPQECVKQLERTVEILQQPDAHSQNVLEAMEETGSKNENLVNEKNEKSL